MPSPFTAAFFAAGTPQPKGSPRPIRIGTRLGLTVKHKSGEAWERAIMHTARAHLPPKPLDCAVRVDLVFCIERPATVTRRVWPHVKPDLDKLTRAALDALQRAGMFVDDSRVCCGEVTKIYGVPAGVAISVGASPHPPSILPRWMQKLGVRCG